MLYKGLSLANCIKIWESYIVSHAHAWAASMVFVFMSEMCQKATLVTV